MYEYSYISGKTNSAHRYGAKPHSGHPLKKLICNFLQRDLINLEITILVSSRYIWIKMFLLYLTAVDLSTGFFK